MTEWLARRTLNHMLVGSSPAEATWLIKNRPAWATSDDNGASVHSAVNEYLAMDRVGNCTWIARMQAGVYSPGSCTGDRCNRSASKALWASFGKKKRYIRTA